MVRVMRLIATAIVLLAVSVAASAFYVVRSERHPAVDVYVHQCDSTGGSAYAGGSFWSC